MHTLKNNVKMNVKGTVWWGGGGGGEFIHVLQESDLWWAAVNRFP